MSVGRWPAIAIGSLSCSVPQLVFQNADRPDLGALALLAAFGVHVLEGIFLRYPWRRHRVVWPVVAANAVANAAPITLLFG